jgi:hypothetical protein
MRLFSRRGASMDRGQRNQLANKTSILVPGPDIYNPIADYYISKNSAPKYRFGTS